MVDQRIKSVVHVKVLSEPMKLLLLLKTCHDQSIFMKFYYLILDLSPIVLRKVAECEQ